MRETATANTAVRRAILLGGLCNTTDISKHEHAQKLTALGISPADSFDNRNKGNVNARCIHDAQARRDPTCCSGKLALFLGQSPYKHAIGERTLQTTKRNIKFPTATLTLLAYCHNYY